MIKDAIPWAALDLAFLSHLRFEESWARPSYAELVPPGKLAKVSQIGRRVSRAAHLLHSDVNQHNSSPNPVPTLKKTHPLITTVCGT